jgi:hypothetical protein
MDVLINLIIVTCSLYCISKYHVYAINMYHFILKRNVRKTLIINKWFSSDTLIPVLAWLKIMVYQIWL